MRLTKSLLCGISALVLAAGTAFAGQDSTMESSVENSSPELLAGPELMEHERMASGSSGSSSMKDGDRQYFVSPESDVMYLYPIEVTEYYLLIIPQSPELG